MASLDAHRRHAEALRAVVLGERAQTDSALRAAALRRAAGGPPIPDPHDELAAQIGAAAHRVTDAQVAAVRAATGSDKAAFEVVMAACVGAGLARWDAAARAIDGTGDASA